MSGTRKGQTTDPRLGIGLAGLVAGLLTGAVFLSPTGGPTAPHGAPTERAAGEAQETPELSGKQDQWTPVLRALMEGHQELHGLVKGGDVQGEEGQLPKALETAIRADPWALDIRETFHRRLGPGVFVNSRGLTPVGRALLSRLNEVPDHGLDINPYQLGTLRRLLEPLQQAEQEAASLQKAGAAERLALRLLEAPTFRETRARVALEALGETLGEEDVRRLTEKLTANKQGALDEESIAKLETAMGRSLTKLLLDFRFLRVVGPFNRTLREERMLARTKHQEEIADGMMVLVEDPDPERALADLDPIHPSYAPLVEGFKRYRAMAEEGNWPKLDTTWKIHPGMEGKQVRVLSERLKREGYLKGDARSKYDDELLEAVRDYQRHHELNPDGYVYEGTIRSMNVQPTRRMDQIALALQRMREVRHTELGDFYLRVNVPLFEMHAIRDGKVVRRHRVIVGTNRLDDDKVRLVQGHINRTELFTTNLYEVIVHPDWILPERVEQGELKAKMQTDPDYMKRNRIITQKLDDGSEVLIQVGGEGNVLGKVKFMLERSRAIFLHDTDKKHLFRELRRDFSHGCIRVDRAVDFARWVLLQDGWDEKEVKRSLKAEKTQRGMKLETPIPLITEYMTVDAASDGKPIFLTDLYGFDRAYRQKDLPPKVEALWGSGDLRPNWVPPVEESVVMEWKAAGKHAPHNNKVP